MAELVFFRRSEELMRINLDGHRVTVGRAPNNDILVPDNAVSRLQFALQQTTKGWTLEDLSGNGTEIAGERLFQTEIDDGADIGLGQWRAVFSLSSGNLEAEATQQEDSEGTAVQPTPFTNVRPAEALLRLRSRAGESTVPLRGEVVVGSAPDCTVQLADPFVSARHVKFERQGSRVRVCDLQSRNGIFVGGVRLWEAEIPFGCPVMVGGWS